MRAHRRAVKGDRFNAMKGAWFSTFLALGAASSIREHRLSTCEPKSSAHEWGRSSQQVSGSPVVPMFTDVKSGGHGGGMQSRRAGTHGEAVRKAFCHAFLDVKKSSERPEGRQNLFYENNTFATVCNRFHYGYKTLMM